MVNQVELQTGLEYPPPTPFRKNLCATRCFFVGLLGRRENSTLNFRRIYNIQSPFGSVTLTIKSIAATLPLLLRLFLTFPDSLSMHTQL